eukprot:jgi/Galph1/3253/GphlegSOOS_G1926.1
MTIGVFFYVPNLIGYLRIILAIAAFFYWQQRNYFFFLYLTSFLLDAADGYAARLLHQSSELGALLDMITDRCATAALLTILSHLYSKYAVIFLFLVMLDGFSHWLQMVAGLATDTTSHKLAGTLSLLKIYYWRPVLTIICLLNELCFLSLYLCYFLPPFSITRHVTVFIMSKGSNSRVLILPFRHSVQADPKYAERTWESLKNAIKEISKHNTGVLSYEELYRNAYNLVLHKHGDLLYDGLKECLKELLGDVVKKVAGQPETTFLESIRQEWEWHKVSMVHIRDILMYMDRTYVIAKKKTPVYDLGLDLFRKVFIQSPLIYERLMNGLLSLIKLEREGVEVNGQLLSSLIMMLRDLSGEQENEKVLQDFETRLLKNTSEFYYMEAQVYLSTCNCPDYLCRVEQRLIEEEERNRTYFQSSCTAELKKVVQNELITRHMETIVDMENSGLIYLVRNDCLNDLSRMYRLFYQVPSGDELFRLRFKKEIHLQTSALLSNEEIIREPVRWVEQVLKLRRKYIHIVYHAFDTSQRYLSPSSFSMECHIHSGHSSNRMDTDKYDMKIELGVDKKLLQTVNDSFEFFLNQFGRTSEYLSLYLDHCFRTDFKNASEMEIDNCLEEVICLFRALRDKDVFERYYKQHLAKRLLFGKNFSEDIERIFIEKLKSECGYQFTSKLEGMFTDMKTSAEEVEAFHAAMEHSMENLGGIDFQVTVLTTGYWPIRNQPNVRIPPEMALCCQAFERVYMTRHSGRRLSWQAQMGSVELRACFPSRKHELQVSTYQAIVLLLFNRYDHLSFRQLVDETGILNHELVRCLQSLACGKHRILAKEPKGKEIVETDTFSFNQSFKSKLFRIKIANILRRKKQKRKKRKLKEEWMMIENRRLKRRFLVSEVIGQLQHHFIPEPAEIKRRIESLIEREFLERDSNQRSYRYVA